MAIRLESGKPMVLRRGEIDEPRPALGVPSYADLQELCRSLLDAKQLADLLKSRALRLVREAPGIGKVELAVEVSPTLCTVRFTRVVETAVLPPVAPVVEAPPPEKVGDKVTDPAPSDGNHCVECTAILLPGFGLCPVCGASQPGRPAPVDPGASAGPVRAATRALPPPPVPASAPERDPTSSAGSEPVASTIPFVSPARNRIHAAVLAFVIGPSGAHEFYVGRQRRGAMFLAVLILSGGALGMILWLIAIVQGVGFLAGGDREFDRTLGKVPPDEPPPEKGAPEAASPRRIEVATALAVIFGPLGAHAFYLGRPLEGTLLACSYMALAPFVLSRPEIAGYTLLFWTPALTRVLHWWTCLGREGFTPASGGGEQDPATKSPNSWTAFDVGLYVVAIAVVLGLVGQTFNHPGPPKGLTAPLSADPR